MSDQADRARRREARREGMTLQRVALGSNDDVPPRGATMAARILAIWPLTLQVWAFSGREVVRLPRAAWPGRLVRGGVTVDRKAVP